MDKMQKYLRLLTYENACKVIDFVNENDKNDHAYITPGGVALQVSESNWDKIENFIASLGVRYEVGTEAPYKVEQGIYERYLEGVSLIALMEEPKAIEETPPMTKNIKGEKCPECGSEEISTMMPRTLYECGSSDYDQRPGTFEKSVECHARSLSNKL